jgi:hypothetical protein
LAYADELNPYDTGADTCPFCVMAGYFINDDGADCKICPVCIYTGIKSCYGTEYYNIVPCGVSDLIPVEKILTQLEKICDQWLNDDKH